MQRLIAVFLSFSATLLMGYAFLVYANDDILPPITVTEATSTPEVVVAVPVLATESATTTVDASVLFATSTPSTPSTPSNMEDLLIVASSIASSTDSFPLTTTIPVTEALDIELVATSTSPLEIEATTVLPAAIDEVFIPQSPQDCTEQDYYGSGGPFMNIGECMRFIHGAR